jgi:PAS domain S-box-containing protein
VLGDTRWQGYDRGGSWLDAVHPEDAGLAAAHWARACAERSGFAAVLRLVDAGGAARRYRVRLVPLDDERTDLWLAFAYDDEALAKATVDTGAASHEAARAAAICAVVARADGSVDFWNAALRAYTGFEPALGARVDWAQLVHPDDLPAAVARVADAAEGERELALRLRGADGRYRWFAVRFSPLLDGDGAVLRWYGSATDIHERTRAGEGLAVLDEVSELLFASRDLDEALVRTATITVPRIADLCAIFLRRADGSLRPAALHHANPERMRLARELMRRYPQTFGERAPRQAHFAPEVTRQLIRTAARDPEHAALLARLDVASSIEIPLVARDEAIGHLQLTRGAASDRFTPADFELAQILAKRLAVAIDNAQIFERERNVAHTFQQAALPRTLPVVPRLELDAVYVAGTREAEIGGDWYDALALDDGTVLISIGDVAGKGLDAAVQMATLRQAIRVAALQGLLPTQILAVAEASLNAERPGRFATAFVAKLSADLRTLSYASAGHPSPLVRDRDGVRPLALGGPPLGVAAAALDGHLRSLRPPWLLVAYTDGLIESTGDILVGEERLRRVIAHDGIDHTGRPADYIRARTVGPTVRDDTAILTLRVDGVAGAPRHWRFSSDDALRAEPTRRNAMRWIAQLAHGDLAAAEVIYGELIGNVVRHAPGPIDVDLVWEKQQLRLYVQDGGDLVNVRSALPAPMSESGRGLYITHTLGRELRCEALPVFGKQISVTLPVEPLLREPASQRGT